MILPSLDGSFGCIASVAIWWDLLGGDVVFPKCFFEFVGAFIVEDVEFGCISVRLELGICRLVQALVSSLAWRVFRGLERIMLLS